MAVSATHNRHFEQLVQSGRPVGEVIGVDHFIVRVRGLQPVNIHSLVIFENGDKGYVNQINLEYVSVLYLGRQTPSVGMVVVVQNTELICKVGKDFIGRVINASGDPIDGKGPIATQATRSVFNNAVPLIEREVLTEQLETGVIAIDALVPIVRGQRMALLGDAKSGKTTILTQLAINQKNTDQIVVYVLIAKKRSDVNTLLSRLQQTDSLNKAIIIVSTVFESLVMSYLVPYVGCAMAEYLWQELDQDVIIVYDDLTAHAQAYREISLLTGVNPGRASYPGDMFFAHSSLLERAGRLKKNKKHLTSIPVMLADDGDITQFLPTNIMSITDGQWILDMDVFRKSIRPAINLGLSVTRVGGAGHNSRQKSQRAQIMKELLEHRSTEEYSYFGAEMSEEARDQLIRGRVINEILTQSPTETFSLLAQQLMLDIISNFDTKDLLNTSQLKKLSPEYAEKIKNQDDYPKIIEELKSKVIATQKA